MTRYIITDPCYLLDDDVWQKCCKAAERPDHSWDDELFATKVANELTKMTGQKAWASETGFGDWSNTMCGNNVKIIQSYFVADSGMVSVCVLTPEIEAHGFDYFGAIIECEGDVTVNFDKEDSNWTVVYIKDAVDCFHSLLSPYADEEEEEDDE